MKNILALVILLFAQTALAAANFSITPVGVVPTTVVAGQSVSAYYILTNMTNTQRNGYFLAGLPSTVTQNTNPPNCSSPINLPPHASCRLQFTITGAALTNVAICKGSSCTTASVPLNVSVTASATPTPTPVLTMPRYLYVVNSYNTPAVDVCALNGTTGAILSCQDAGGSATFGAIPLTGIVINNLNTVAYISNGNGSSATPFTYQCQIDSTNHTFSSCTSTTITAPTGYTPYEGMLGINSTSTLVYLTDNASRILACPISGNTISPTCVDTGATPISSNVVGVVVNKAGTTAYIGNYNSPTGVNVCAANGSTFSACVNKTGGSVGGTPFSFVDVGNVALNNKEDTLYITDSGATKTYACSTTPSGSTTFSSCFVANSTDPAYNIVINATNTVAYLTNFGTTVSSCPILSDGTFPTCTPFTVTGSATGLGLLY